ncbi:GATA zinc finger [Ancylostoma duodenale]|uniref:GATA zinc finger n=1 Tax=Ancylostoma duodenale TaxID=51022 RepID=A0A0C2G6T0_9BILA|nr:GATA zinc finger [Ancylostoma duodenale]
MNTLACHDYGTTVLWISDPTALCLPPAPITLHGCFEDGYGIAQQQHLASVYYEPSSAVQTPLSSPEAPVGATPGQFEEYSLATQLPVLNGYNGTYARSETATTMVTSTKFRSLEQYSAQYFFTTPPDTPPSVLAMAPLSAPPNPCSTQPNSSQNSDPTPTIRKLLQQKKRRMPAVPCHVNSVCTTCKTRTTSLWRRNHLGEIECNACNLYFRKNNCKRPATLRKDEIMKRKRKPRVDSSHTTDVRIPTNVEINQIYPEQKPLSFT